MITLESDVDLSWSIPIDKPKQRNAKTYRNAQNMYGKVKEKKSYQRLERRASQQVRKYK